jgi:acetoin:2,6-dichlorophenolindophenol oxidoreductase subunit alpha
MIDTQFEQWGFLGNIADPLQYRNTLDVSGIDPATLRAHLRMMLVIRRAEEKIGDGVTAGDVVCPCHLGIGQEAIGVGVSAHLKKSDRVFGTHRSHAHYLAMGGSLYELFAEILGKQDGCSKGMGGSMHLQDVKNGFVGSVPIVAGTVPLAVGAALAVKKDGAEAVAVAYFGDGAAEEGCIHESLNLAAVLNLPVLFVCENNLFSSHLHISLRQPGNRVSRYADAHAVRAEVIDGNDVVAVSMAAHRMLSAMRAGEGPAFLEAVTYRWRGHVGPREDNDVGVNRGAELALWKQRDPVRRLFDALKSTNCMGDGDLEHMDAAVTAEVAQAWARAKQAPYPEDSALLDLVYAQND